MKLYKLLSKRKFFRFIPLFFLYILFICNPIISKAQFAKQLDEKAKSFYYNQNFDSAIYYSEKALLIRETNKEVIDTNYSNNLSNLGLYFYFSGKLSKAAYYFDTESKSIEKNQGKKNINYTNSLNNLASVYYDLGDFSKAIITYTEMRDILKDTFGEKHPDYSKAIGSIGLIYSNIGNFDKAEPLLLDAMNLRKKYAGNNDLGYANSLNDIAIFYKAIGNYAKAELFWIEAKNIYKEFAGPKSAAYSSIINNLAVLYQELAIFSNDRKLSLENLMKSEMYLVESTEIDKEILGEKNKEYAISLNNLAALYMSLGFYSNSKKEANNYYNKAEDLFSKSMTIRKEVYGEKHFVYANSLFNLAGLYQLKKDFSKAESNYLEALAIRKVTLGDKHPEYIQNLNSLGRLYEFMNDDTHAEIYYLDNINKRLDEIQRNFNFLSESEKEKFVNSITNDFDCFYEFALKYNKKINSLTGSIYNCFTATKGLVLNSSVRLQNEIQKSNDTTLIHLYEEWVKQKVQIGTFEQYSKNTLKVLRINLDSIENIATTTEKELIRKSAIFSENQKIASISWQEVQKNLKKDETAIEFIKFNKSFQNVPDSFLYCALIIRPGYSEPKMIYLFEESQLEGILNKMTSNRGVQILEQPATKEKSIELYDLIWKPIDSLLKGTKTVFFSPIGLLYRVSFSAMTSPDHKYLFDIYNLKVVSCTRNINAGNKSLLVSPDFNTTIYGGIHYNLDKNKQLDVAKKYKTIKPEDVLVYNENSEIKNINRGGAWNYLKGTLVESDAIVKELNKNKIKTQLISGDDAVEESFKAFSGKSPSVLHIATHGFYIADNNENKNTSNPLNRSGLIMAGANRVWTGEKSIDGIDDGILTAYEVSLLDLSNTKLVVLSACETGLGDIKGSEGVYGLQRAFKMAGVDYLIITLWEIQDEVTVEFMSIFYQQWLKGKDIHAAFKFAQDEMRKKYEANYWAAFVLMD